MPAALADTKEGKGLKLGGFFFSWRQMKEATKAKGRKFGRHEKSPNEERPNEKKVLNIGLRVGPDSPLQAQGLENIALDRVASLGMVK